MGTFAILLPITVSVFDDQLLPSMAITTAAVLGGSVCGDHISLISNNTILSSAGAGCSHINYVSMQMQYGIVTTIGFTISYIVSGYTENVLMGFIFGVLLLVAFIVCVKRYYNSNSVR